MLLGNYYQSKHAQVSACSMKERVYGWIAASLQVIWFGIGWDYAPANALA